MNTEKRQKVLKMILPSAVVLTLYIWIFGMPAQSRLTDATEARDKARAEAPGAMELNLARQRTAMLIDHQRKMKTEKTELLQRVVACIAELGSGQGRTEKLQAVTSGLGRQGLTLLEDGKAGKEYEAALSMVLKKELKSMEGAPAVDPVLWRIRFVGRYLDVLQYMENLFREKTPIIPMGLTMEKANPGTTHRIWSLLLWI